MREQTVGSHEDCSSTITPTQRPRICVVSMIRSILVYSLNAAASVYSAGRNSLPRTLLRYTAGALPRPPAPACPYRRDEPVGAWLRRRTVCGNPLWGLPHTGQWPAHYSRSHAFCGRSQPIDSPPFARESGCSAPPLTLHTNSPCRCGCQVPETTPTAGSMGRYHRRIADG